MSYVQPAPGNLPASNGPFILGISMSCVLTGMLITQTWNYFERYEQDTLPLKFSAALVCFLNIVSTGLDLQIVWNIGVTHFGDYAALHKTPLSHQYSVLLTSFVGLSAQIFFAQRSWRAVNRNIPMATLFAVLIGVTFTGAFGSEVAHLSKANQTAVVKPFALVWLWTASVTDVIISAVLMYRLWRSRQQPDVPERTRGTLDGVLVLVLSTAAVTTLATSIDAIFFTFFSHATNTHTALTICIPRLYGNCLLFTLNSRSKLRSNLHAGRGSGSGSSSGRVVPTWHGRNSGAPTARNHRGVMVTRTQEVEAADASQIDLDKLAYRAQGPRVRGQKDSFTGSVGSDGPRVKLEVASPPLSRSKRGAEDRGSELSLEKASVSEMRLEDGAQ